MQPPNSLDTVDYDASPVAGLACGGAIGALHVAVEVGAASDAGPVRSVNEDHYLISRIRRRADILASNVSALEVPACSEWDGWLLAVADGLGGHSAGDRASQMVLKKGLDLVLSHANWAMAIDDADMCRIVQHLREAFVDIERHMLLEMEGNAGLKGMASTLTAVYSVSLQAFLLHVGDSRAYRLREGRLEQLTRDHTLAQSLVDRGEIPHEEARTHSRRHVLTNVLAGRPGAVVPDIATFRLQDGDRLLLCSDGLNETLSDSDIAALWQQAANAPAAAEALVREAIRRGSRDNVTAVIATFAVASRS